MFVTILKFVLLVVGGYFIGNFSSAKFLSKLKKDDITKHGSGNPGTMNMLRTYGIGLGIATLVMDALKGAIPSLIGLYLFGGPSASLGYIGLFTGGFASILGHIFPVVFKFKGGKGVACILGMFVVAEPIWALIAFGISLVSLLLFQYGVLTSFIFITLLIIKEGYKFSGNVVICVLLFCIFFLSWFMHRQNFFRLLIGKENKINLFKKKKRKFKYSNTQNKSKKQIKKETKKREIG